MTATSYISLTEGSGRKIASVQRTIGADTVESYLVNESEPFLAAYTVSVTTAVSTATANDHLLQIMAGASLRVGLRRLTISQIVGAGASTQARIEIRRLTTAGTGGTSYTPAPNDPADAASGATAMTLPSAKGTEGSCVGGPWVCLLHATIATVGINPVLDRQFALNGTKSPWIAAGAANGLAVKIVTAVATATVHITAEIVEASWAA